MAAIPLFLLLLLFPVFSPAEQTLRTFHLIVKSMTQSEAQAACRENYTDLVTVYNNEENTALINLINTLLPANSRVWVWIGLQRSEFSSKWSNGDDVTFSALTGSCGPMPCCAAMMTDASWDSRLCTETRNFMCYKQDQTDLTFSYHLITDQSLNWYDAQSYCRKNYTDLISIRDQDQNEAVKISGMNSSAPFWIGLLCDDWEWADGGRSAYRNWGTGSPESPSSLSNCVELKRGKWYSIPCSNSPLPALCYNTSVNVSDDQMTGMSGTPNYCKKEHFSTVFSPTVQRSSLTTFYLIENNLNQSEAREACGVNYTDLVTVYNDEDITALIRLTGIGSAWTGLYRNQSSVMWSNGDDVTFSALTGDCTSGSCCSTMNPDGSWDNNQCTETRNFMCYKQDETDLTFSYHLITDQSLNWYDAQSYCRKIYTDLISIRDQDQNEAVRMEGMNSSTPFWIGLLCDDWQWADGGSSDYRNWWDGHPKPSPADCVKLVSGKFYSVPCSNTGSALCYSTSVNVSDDHMTRMSGTPNYCMKVQRSRLTTFYLIENNMTQPEAREACGVNYTDLVTVYNDEDITALIRLTGIGSAWTGLYRNQPSVKWSNGDDVIFSALTGDCSSWLWCSSMKADGSWDNIQCTENKTFMCYTQDETDLTFSYHLITDQSLNWYDAQSYCRKIYTDLISIRDQDQNEAVRKAGMNSSTPFWIGLLRDDWQWADGGRSDYRNWWDGHPKPSPADCVKLVSGKFYSVPCSNTGSALCYSTSLHVSDDRVKWENAMDYCKQENRTGLLHILTQSDHIDVKNELRRKNVSDTFLWVGLGQSHLFGFWFWSDGSGLGDWTNWVRGEVPKPPLSQHCGAIDTTRDFKWLDKDCRYKFRVLCTVK